MEYRGYDSAGLAIMNGRGVEVRKAAGKISRLEAAVAANPLSGTLGIAHTRWATHGAPSERNAHPLMDEKHEVAVVHNGIIENATALRKMLEEHGHVFSSETDTEVLVHLIEAAFDGSLEGAVIEALQQVEGAYGIAVVSSRDPEKIVAGRIHAHHIAGALEHTRRCDPAGLVVLLLRLRAANPSALTTLACVAESHSLPSELVVLRGCPAGLADDSLPAATS